MKEIPPYYTRLFNGVTDAIDALQHMKYSEGLNLLIQAQQDAEALYMDEEDEEDAEESYDSPTKSAVS